MKNILFILPSLKTGGTISAFNSLYNVIKNRTGYNISVFSMSHHRTADIAFDDVLLQKDVWIEAYNAHYSEMSRKEKMLAQPIKILKRLGRLAGLDISEYLYSRQARKLQKQKFDVVIAYQEDGPTFFAKYFEKAYKVAWIHCNYRYRSQALKYSEIDVYSSFDRIVNVSKYTNEEFLKIYPSLKGKCEYIYNILDYDQIKLKALLYEPKEFLPSKINIISVGRVANVKRFYTIPDIAKKLLGRGLDFNWFIVGPDESNAERLKITDEIKDKEVSCVHLLGARSNPYPYIKNADILVCTSESEACPMIFNEAKSLGTPIITTNFGSAYEFVDDRVNGLITSIEDMENCIVSFLTDEKLNEYIKRCSQSFYNPNEEILNKFEKIVELKAI